MSPLISYVFVVLVFQEAVDLLLWRLRLRETQTEVEESVSIVVVRVVTVPVTDSRFSVVTGVR